jgi:hypothetical protein
VLQIVDMPPGTGDIQITLTQGVSLTGAVIVTTPHALSVVDAAKGILVLHFLFLFLFIDRHTQEWQCSKTLKFPR